MSPGVDGWSGLMDAGLLRDVGEALYGSHWQIDLAREIGASDRSMRHWISGQRPMPSRFWVDIRALAERRKLEINAILLRLPPN